jgi:hypothetical protein
LASGIEKHPVTVTVDTTNWSLYRSGIFNNCKASINHAVLLVGVSGGNWKIKNSWGTGWASQVSLVLLEVILVVFVPTLESILNDLDNLIILT